MKVRLFMIAECIMWTFPGGMPDASIRHGMRRRSDVGLSRTLVVAMSRDIWNGVVFDITQGHVYGQLSKDQTHNSYIDVIERKGSPG